MKVKKGFKAQYGFTKIHYNNEGLLISHGGNMGNSIIHSVDPNLAKLGFPSIEEMKKTYEVIKEEGWPDYMWSILFKI